MEFVELLHARRQIPGHSGDLGAEKTRPQHEPVALTHLRRFSDQPLEHPVGPGRTLDSPSDVRQAQSCIPEILMIWPKRGLASGDHLLRYCQRRANLTPLDHEIDRGQAPFPVSVRALVGLQGDLRVEAHPGDPPDPGCLIRIGVSQQRGQRGARYRLLPGYVDEVVEGQVAVRSWNQEAAGGVQRGQPSLHRFVEWLRAQPRSASLLEIWLVHPLQQLFRQWPVDPHSPGVDSGGHDRGARGWCPGAQPSRQAVSSCGPAASHSAPSIASARQPMP